ncbi:hypothetical protein [Streptomyces sp. NRRL S-340]|uniref:hypothetical protein n=1 Tax=Streptomyces sp. NRRL S-340 TaxID=1463901 RepID=UPI000566C871|nr:hypothetical protein [Streptomyces sp. NRRL S-340]
MTQSGQGEEPSARPAREGIVLPSDGGQPLLPGTTGGPGGLTPAQPAGQGPAHAPAGGQAWGQPWGPGAEQAPPQPSGQDWQTPSAQAWGAAPSSSQTPPARWDAQGQPGGPGAAGAGPLPPEGAPAPAYGTQSGGAQPPYQQNQGFQGADHGFPPHQQQPHQPHQHQYQPQQGAPGQAAPLPPAGPGPYGTPRSGGAPLPPAGPAPYGLPAAGQGGRGAPADEGATQFLPPVPAVPADEGATQFLPPVPAAPADEGATQYIPPVPAGAMPPETSGDPSTRFLGHVPQGGGAPGAGPDAEATQFIAPVDAQAGGPAAPYGAGPGGPGAPGGRQTPAEFDSLFRDGAGGGAPATQQIPRFQQPYDGRPGPGGRAGAPPVQPGPGGPGGPGQPQFAGQPAAGGGDGGGRRTRSRVPLIAAVGVGIVALGVGAGALLSGGGGGDGGQHTEKAAGVSSAAPSTGGASSAPAADPARQQAVALDKLLADSGSSRASVIKAVADVKGCDNLGGAASDLRAAARQRGELVTRLGSLPVDKLPEHAALTSALTSAWKASQSADQHYAAWADQTHGKKGCQKGHARITSHAKAGNQQSGVASAQKAKAARLWNVIAKKYGLTERQPTQL